MLINLKNYFRQKNIDFIDNNNIKEDHLEVKKLHLNKKSIMFWQITFWNTWDVLFETNAEDIVFKSLKDVRIKNLNCFDLAHLSINSLRNKYNFFTDPITWNVGVLVISETKLDSIFSTSQFKIPGHPIPFKLDQY